MVPSPLGNRPETRANKDEEKLWTNKTAERASKVRLRKKGKTMGPGFFRVPADIFKQARQAAADKTMKKRALTLSGFFK